MNPETLTAAQTLGSTGQIAVATGLAVFIKLLFVSSFWISLSWIFVAKLRYFTGNASRHFQAGVTLCMASEWVSLLSEIAPFTFIEYTSYTLATIGLSTLACTAFNKLRARTKSNMMVC
ncbi:hypothetical protein [Vibrio owensii]|uniref:hypothetical protein n=1 Tax=Vibrio owensii TaxID=696485 RepID=UPI0018F1D928|nr:hypothetical protein [Vibrio owensii]